MHAPTLLLALFTSTALSAPSSNVHKFDPSNPLGLPIPLPLDLSQITSFDPKHIDPAKLAEQFQSLIPEQGSPISDVKKCVAFCDEHKRLCSGLKLGTSISSNLCDAEYAGCVKVCQGA